MDTFFFPTEQNATVDLHGLGDRCLHEPASRRLDGEIYCTINNVKDLNPLVNDRLLQARERGEVLMELVQRGAHLDRSSALHGRAEICGVAPARGPCDFLPGCAQGMRHGAAGTGSRE